MPTARIMNDQFSTVGAGQDVFARSQCGPVEVTLEQRVAGSFAEFSRPTLHDLNEPLLHNGDDHVVS